MLAVKGTYENGVVKLDQPLDIQNSRKVIVTFLEEEEPSGKDQYLTPEDFSFSKAREASESYKGNLSDAVIEERRNER